MIGGLMLLSAVGAMLLIAHWSLERDDLQDMEAATGFLALVPPAQRKSDRARRRAAKAAKTRSPRAATQDVSPEQRSKRAPGQDAPARKRAPKPAQQGSQPTTRARKSPQAAKQAGARQGVSRQADPSRAGSSRAGPSRGAQTQAAPTRGAKSAAPKPKRKTKLDEREMMAIARELDESGNGLPKREDRVGF